MDSAKQESMLLEHDKAITILVATQQNIAKTLEEFKEIHKETTEINKKNQEVLQEIKLSLQRHDILKDTFDDRLKALESSHEGNGCNAQKELSKRVDKIEIAFDDVKNKVSKLWIYGTVAVFFISIVIKVIADHLFK